MSKKIIMLCPSGKSGSPANERFLSFLNFFKSKDCNTFVFDFPINFLQQLKIIFLILKIKPDYIFISQPPFRFWMIFLLPFINIILDIRDGWSIAIKSGYGGTVKPNKLKYFLVTIIENIMLRKSLLVITCTIGLKDYLSMKYNKKVMLITNGISKNNFDLISKLDISPNIDNKIFTCAGQFSEYGVDKVKLILDIISQRYHDSHCIIKVVGANESKNSWIADYLVKYKNMSYVYVDRVNKEELYFILKTSNYALTIIRDPDYDYGTKIFEYLACDLKVINYFYEKNNFTEYFDGAFDLNFSDNSIFDKCIIRESLISEHTDSLVSILK